MNENPDSKPLKAELPKEFLVCPNCKSARRLCAEALRGVPEAGRPPAARGRPIEKVGLYTYPLLIPNLIIPTVYQAVLDVCVDCGTVYAIAIQEVQVKIDLKSLNNPLGG